MKCGCKIPFKFKASDMIKGLQIHYVGNRAYRISDTAGTSIMVDKNVIDDLEKLDNSMLVAVLEALEKEKVKL